MVLGIDVASNAPDRSDLLLTPIEEQACSLVLSIVRDGLLILVPTFVEVVVAWGYGREVLHEADLRTPSSTF